MRNTLKAYSNAKELLKHNKDKYYGCDFVDVYGRKVNLWDSNNSEMKDNISLKDDFSKVGLLRIKVKTEDLLDALKRGDISIGYINGDMDEIEERFTKLIGRRVNFDIEKPYSVLNWGQAFLYLNSYPKRYSEIEYQVYDDELEEKESTHGLKTLKQKVTNELSQVFIPVNRITFESEARILKDETPHQSIELGEDFFGVKEGTEEADDILFALQVQYGDPKLTYDECRKEFTKEEVKRAVARVKRDKLNKFTYFNDSLDKRQRNILAKHILNCNSDKELLDIIYELIDWDNKLFDKAMDIYEGEGSVQYRAKKISDLLTY